MFKFANGDELSPIAYEIPNVWMSIARCRKIYIYIYTANKLKPRDPKCKAHSNFFQVTKEDNLYCQIV